MAFCRWLSDKLGYTVELPHECEWEVAARWPDGRLYPWGNEFDAVKANTYEGNRLGEPTVVGLYPHGANARLNLYDLSGNVWEWCRNRYHSPDEDPDVDEADISDGWRVLRGGSFNSDADGARTAYRNYGTPGIRHVEVGFRLVVVRRCPSHHPEH